MEINIEKFICDCIEKAERSVTWEYIDENIDGHIFKGALREQGLEYKNGKIVKIGEEPKEAELTPKDFMVEDWVIFHDSGYASDGTTWEENRICQIDSIDEDVRVKWYDESGCKEYEPHVSTVFLSPIPLTAEILEKNGMYLYNRKTNNLMEECNHSDCFEEDEDYKVELSLDYNGKIRWTINGDEYTIMPLDYVHQLQHALRLCGISKLIEL